MGISYKPLWKLLIDRDMQKKDLAKLADISISTTTKMGKDASVTLDVIDRICSTLNCRIEDVVEITPTKKEE